MIALASICRVPVSFSSVSAQGRLCPADSIARNFCPASLLPNTEHSFRGPL